MRIGIDLDGVLYNSENWNMAFAEHYDILTSGQGVVDPTTKNIQKRYGWSDEKVLEFRAKYIPDQITKSPLMPYAIEAIKYLHKLGHEIIIITSRGLVCESHKELTKEQLLKDNVYFDDLHFAPYSKLKIVQHLNIDIMIDDNASVVTELASNNIKCLQFKSDNTKSVIAPNIEIVFNWGEVLQKLIK